MKDAYFIVLLVIVMFSFGIAYKMNKHLQEKEVSCKNYVWGYFQGFLGVFQGIFLVVISLFFLPKVSVSDLLIGVAITTLYIPVILRHRWALILNSLWGGPLIWVINFIYIKNRWGELKTLRFVFGSLLGGAGVIRRQFALEWTWRLFVILQTAAFFILFALDIGFDSWSFIPLYDRWGWEWEWSLLEQDYWRFDRGFAANWIFVTCLVIPFAGARAVEWVSMGRNR